MSNKSWTLSAEEVAQIKQQRKSGLSLGAIAYLHGISATTVRYYTDQEKRKEQQRKYYRANREKLIKRMREYAKEKQDTTGTAKVRKPQRKPRTSKGRKATKLS